MKASQASSWKQRLHRYESKNRIAMKAKLIRKNLRIIPVLTFQLILVIVLNSCYSGAKAQYVLKEANQEFEHFNYNEAAKLYLKAWKKKEKPYTAQKLAESYQKMSDYNAAEEWYAKLSSMPDSDPQSKLWYAEALRNQGKYGEAKVQYQQYATLQNATSAPQLQMWISSCDSALVWMANPKNVKLDNLAKLNSTASDWAAVQYGNGIVFTSDRESNLNFWGKKNRPFLKFDGTKIPDKQRYHWTGNRYTRLYYSEHDTISLFPLATDQDYYTGTVSFTGDGKEAFFTMTNLKDLKRNKQDITTIYIGLYSSRLSDGKWTTPAPFRYTDINKWSVGDPYISPDGKVLYFVTDMPGGFGGTDLYKCIRNEDGAWSDAINLGPQINTAGNERSPAIQQDQLYFSSDGRIGMGGLDIYKTALSGTGKVIHLGYPLNSPQDDFATYLTSSSSGFISSNRYNGAGKDDIYSFEWLPESTPPIISTPVAQQPINQTSAITQAIKDSIYTEIIYYNFDKSNIRNDAEIVLKKIYGLMKQYPDSKLVISSYTDSKGAKNYNWHLSKLRATAVIGYFTNKGILRFRIKANGYGESKPAAPNTLKNGKDNPTGRQLNRRSEIWLKDKIYYSE